MDDERDTKQLIDELDKLRQQIADDEKTIRLHQDKQEKLQLALDAGSIATWDCDIPSNRGYGDQKLADFFGIDHSRLVNGLALNEFIDAIHDEDRQQVLARIEEAIQTGERYTAEYRVLNSANECHWVVAHGQVVYDEQGKPARFPGALVDITTRKKAEEELKESEARFSKIFKQNPHPISLLRESDAIYIEVNEAWLSFYGFSKEEVVGHTPVELGILSQNSYGTVRERFTKARSVKDYETTTRTRDGKVKEILSSLSPLQIGGVLCVLNMTVDMTERNRVIKELEKARDLFSRVFHSSPAPMTIALVKDLTYIEVNDSFLRIFDLGRQDVIGRVMGEYNLIEAETRAEIDRQMSQKGEIKNLKIKARSKSGKELCLLISIEIVELAGQQCLVSTLLDITELEEAMEALRESQRFNEVLLNSTPNAIYLYDLEEKRNLYSNEGIYRILGYSVAEIQQMGERVLPMLIQPDDFNAYIRSVIPRYQTLGDEDFIVHEYRMKAKDGGWRWIQSKESIFLRNSDGSPKQIFGIASDITDSTLAEDALRSSELFLNSIIEQTPYALWISDGEGTLIRQNQACRDLFFITDEQMVGKYNVFMDNIVLEQGFMPLVKSVYKEGKTANFKLYYDSSQLKSIELEKTVRVVLEVTIFPIRNTSGKITNAVVQHRDVTEQERTKNELQEREALLTEMSYLAKVGAWEFDAETGDGTWTEEAARIHDLDPEVETNMSFGISFYSGESRQKIERAIKQAIENALPYDLELELNTAKGKRKWVRAIGHPIVRGDRVIKVRGTFQDITELKQAENALKELSENLQEMVDERTRELENAQEMLVRREKLAMLGQLAGGVGHELRNPLGAISNATYFLKMVLPGHEIDPDIIQVLDILENETKKAEGIITTLLDYARSRPPERRCIKINDVVNKALSSVLMPEDQSIQLDIQLDDSDPDALADPGQLEQVLVNIMQNAVQAMSVPHMQNQGGRLLVKTGKESGSLLVSVTDTGVGIPPENISKLFEPLFTTRPKGIGLGLALARMLVEGHGGWIEVESEGVPGKGSTFTIWLPVSEKTGEEEK